MSTARPPPPWQPPPPPPPGHQQQQRVFDQQPREIADDEEDDDGQHYDHIVGRGALASAQQSRLLAHLHHRHSTKDCFSASASPPCTSSSNHYGSSPPPSSSSIYEASLSQQRRQQHHHHHHHHRMVMVEPEEQQTSSGNGNGSTDSTSTDLTPGTMNTAVLRRNPDGFYFIPASGSVHTASSSLSPPGGGTTTSANGQVPPPPPLLPSQPVAVPARIYYESSGGGNSRPLSAAGLGEQPSRWVSSTAPRRTAAAAEPMGQNNMDAAVCCSLLRRSAGGAPAPHLMSGQHYHGLNLHQHHHHQRLSTLGLKAMDGGSGNAKRQQARRSQCSSLTWLLGIALLLSLLVVALLLAKDGHTTAASDASSQAVQGAPSQVAVSPQRRAAAGSTLPNILHVDQTDDVKARLAPNSLSFTELHLDSPARIRFKILTDGAAKIALLARRTIPPTLVQYDIFRPLRTDLASRLDKSASGGGGGGGRKKRRLGRRSLSGLDDRVVWVDEKMSEGRWHLALLNDRDRAEPIRLRIETINLDGVEEDVADDGDDRTCPILCSGRGSWLGGVCRCDEGFKGADCDLPSSACTPSADCSGRGTCTDKGVCECEQGWTGASCNETACPVDCHHPNGLCQGGVCFCAQGWIGDDCSLPSQHLNSVRSNDVEEHGGGDETCPNDCSQKGTCTRGVCTCFPTWQGDDCSQRTCLDGCSEHGDCDDDAKCVCHLGWNGANCQLVGCPRNCSSHGHCEQSNSGHYHCQCEPGWSGDACRIALETECSNGLDDDGDGDMDCEDSDCCSSAVCASSPHCATVADPRLAARRATPSGSTSFFDRHRFLIANDSVQLYADRDQFNASTVSVLRGRAVVGPDGVGVAGVRVSLFDQPLLGFTLSRHAAASSQDGAGEFDLLANGARLVRLQLRRPGYKMQERSMWLPAGRVLDIGDVHIDDVVSEDDEDDAMETAASSSSPLCSALKDHLARSTDYPQVDESWRPQDDGGNSSAALTLHLLGDHFDRSIRLVHVRVRAAGRRWRVDVAAEPNLVWTLNWDGMDVYGRPMHGLVQADVRIGFTATVCPAGRAIWLRRRPLLAADPEQLFRGETRQSP